MSQIEITTKLLPKQTYVYFVVDKPVIHPFIVSVYYMYSVCALLIIASHVTFNVFSVISESERDLQVHESPR